MHLQWVIKRIMIVVGHVRIHVQVHVQVAVVMNQKMVVAGHARGHVLGDAQEVAKMAVMVGVKVIARELVRVTVLEIVNFKCLTKE